VEFAAPEPPKFLRDHIQIQDIEGAHPRKPKYFATRDIMKTKDIGGSSPRKTYQRATEYDNFNYNDITKTKFVSSRHTNPLSPSYVVRNDENQVVNTQAIEGAQPKLQPKRKHAD